MMNESLNGTHLNGSQTIDSPTNDSHHHLHVGEHRLDDYGTNGSNSDCARNLSGMDSRSDVSYSSQSSTSETSSPMSSFNDHMSNDEPIAIVGMGRSMFSKIRAQLMKVNRMSPPRSRNIALQAVGASDQWQVWSR